MQHQTVPQDSATGGYRVAFDVNAGIAPLTFPADATPAHITDRLHRAFLTADVIRDGHEFAVVVDVQAGTVVVRADGDVIEHGSITPIEPEQPAGVHIDLADVLRSLALDIVDYKLPLPRYYFTLRACLESRADVQAWADHFGVPVTMGGTDDNIPAAEQKLEFGDGRSLDVIVQGPAEARSELERMRARVAELEAKLAGGGEPR